MATAACLAVPARASQRAAGRTTFCSERSWVGGTVERCGGALVYRDYVYDDTGADSKPGSPHGTLLNRATGDVDHTTHGQAMNSADLVTLRMAPSGKTALHVRFELNTLFAADQTLAAIAIDTDNNPLTGGGPWHPRIKVSSAGHDVVFVFDRRDAEANVIEGDVPMPSSRTWRVQAVTALGDGTVMNVAFRGTKETGSWWEGTQSKALAAGDISSFGHVFTAREFTRRRDVPALPGAGYFERIYTSNHPLGEGVNYDGVGEDRGPLYSYLGRHQPYGVYVPPKTGAPYGMQLALHGLNAAHASLVNLPGMQARFGDELHRIVVVPLARGPEGKYADYAERDVLDVMADVQAVYPVDRERVFSGGYSMGGGGAYQMAERYPDRFAAMVNWVGFTGDCLNGTGLQGGRGRLAGGEPVFSNDPADSPGCPNGAVGNALDYLDNLRSVPSALLYAAADELVWANHAVALRQRYADLGYEHVLWLHAAEHLSFALIDDWRKEAAWSAGRTRVRTPSRVTYRTNPWTWRPELGLVHDGAYWVDGLRTRDKRASGNDTLDAAVDLISHACSSTEYTITLSNGVGIDPVPWVSQVGTRDAAAPPAPAPGNVISGTLENVGEVTIDVAAACLDPTKPIVLDVVTDGPTTLHFKGGLPDQIVS